MARSDAWAQLLASGLRCPLFRCEGAHTAAALGAARLAWLADGASVDQVCQSLPTERTFVPEATGVQLLAERYPRYRALYPALVDLF